MKFKHTIIIEQLPNGDTRFQQNSQKIGDGRPSAEMREAMQAFFHAFTEFQRRYKPDVNTTITAVPGSMMTMERAAIPSLKDINIKWD